MEALTYRRATPGDSAALCELMRATPMGHAVRVSQQRGDDFFAGSRLQAERPAVWAAFEPGGRAVGLFSAGARRVFVGGRIESVRYLSDLRIHPEYRGGLVMARGFKILQSKVFAAGEWAQTLVLDDNAAAAKLLTSRRGGLPEYRPCGRYTTCFLRGQRVRGTDPTIRVRRAEPDDLNAMHDLQTRHAPGAEFTPLLDFAAMPEVDFRLAFRGGELLGQLGIWDVARIRGTRIDGYSLPLRLARPAYNIWAGARRLPRLPPPGAMLPAKAVTAVLCRDRDPRVLRALLSSVLLGNGLYGIGLDTEDPLAAALRGLRAHRTTAGHYLVGFNGQPPPVRRPFYFDFARL